MIANEIVEFLLPDFSDTIQVTFLVILVVMFVTTFFSVLWWARPSSWEKKWSQGASNTDSDYLDIEHGSVTDLWHAVATAPEKAADIMPSMLLVVGLLGTFIGLGIALDNASSILGQPEAMSVSGAANSMNDLLGVLQGLGTKFKTSTWGIVGFVFLKFFLEVIGFADKRLTWVIKEVKKQLNQREQQNQAAEAEKQKQLYKQMGTVTQGVVEGISNNFALLLKQSHEDKVAYLDALNLVNNNVEALKRSNREVGNSIHKAVESQTSAICESLHSMQVGTAEYLQSIQSNTAESLNALKNFTTNTEIIVDKMACAAHEMSVGSERIGGAAEQLVGAVDLFKDQFTNVLDNVRHDLSAAITDMSQQATETLERGAQQLNNATGDISTALTRLSGDVKDTMNEVQTSISTALEIQQRSQTAFTISTDTLTEKIDASTRVVEAMTKPIEAGLRAISASNRYMTSIGEKIEESNSNLNAAISLLKDIPTSLAPLEQLTMTLGHVKGISTLLGNIEKSVNQMAEELEQLKHLEECVPQIKVLPSLFNELIGQVKPIEVLVEQTAGVASDTQSMTQVSENVHAMLGVLKTLRSDLYEVTHPEISEVAN